MTRIPYTILATLALIRGAILSLLGRKYGCWNWSIFPLGNRRRYTTCHIGLDLAESRRMYDRCGWIPLVFRTVDGLPSREFLIEKTDDEIELERVMCVAYVEYAERISREMAEAKR